MDRPPALSSPVLDDALAFDGPDRALELLELFTAVLEECLAAIAAASLATAPGAVREPAHRLKGSAAMFGDATLAAAAARLETAVVAEDAAAADDARTLLQHAGSETRRRLTDDRALLAAAAGAPG